MVTCFMLQRTDRVRRYMRRYVALESGKCSGKAGYHGAKVRMMRSQGPCVSYVVPPEEREKYKGWPEVCEAVGCGYRFTAEDAWQVFTEEIWRLPDSGETTLRDATPGAMWVADWMPEPYASWAPDKKPLVVVCPGGTQWLIDGPASNAPKRQPGWTRNGEPPTVTVRPSINVPGYHGWLTAGVFSPPC